MNRIYKMSKKKNKREEASEKYRPSKIKFLFIAESPPFCEKGKTKIFLF